MSLSVKNTLGGGSIGSVENLLVPTLGTQTKNGVTCTNNGDGTYTLNGTATSETNFTVTSIKLPIGEYKILGCPKGGNKDNGYYIFANGNGLMYDEGNGVICSVTTPRTVNFYLSCASGTVCDNLVFKPMLTTNLKATYKEFVKRVGGFNNLINITATNKTMNGITFTVKSDGTITANGTATADAYIEISTQIFPDGVYKLSGCPKGGSGTGYQLNFSGLGSFGVDYGNGCVGTLTGQTNNNFLIIYIRKNTVCNNLVFKPMLTESLLPEYYDFVKGIESALLTKADCGTFSKVAVDTYTPTSDTPCSSPNIPHSLGTNPMVAIIIAPNGQKISGNYDTVCIISMIGGLSEASYKKIGYMQVNRLYNSDTAYYINGAVSSSEFSGRLAPSYVNFNSSGANWTAHFKAGTTYTLITMAI